MFAGAPEAVAATGPRASKGATATPALTAHAGVSGTFGIEGDGYRRPIIEAAHGRSGDAAGSGKVVPPRT